MVISPHLPKLGKNRAVGTSRNRYRGCRRHMCRRCGVPINPPPIRVASPSICFAEAVATALHTGGLDGEDEIALHLADVLLAEKLEVFEGGVFLIIYGNAAHSVQRLVEPLQIIRQVRRHGLVLGFERGDALLRLPNLVIAVR